MGTHAAGEVFPYTGQAPSAAAMGATEDALMLRISTGLRAAMASLLLVSANGFAQDWGSCASDLDDLRRTAEDASSEAEDAGSKKEEADQAEDDLRQCLQFPEIYDLLRDRCSGKRSDYEVARSSYRSQLSALQSSLDDVDSKVRSVSSSCGYNISRMPSTAPSVPQGVRSPAQCAVYLRYKGRLSVQSLMQLCRKQMSAEECKKCLD